MYFKNNNQFIEILLFEKKEPNCILLYTRSPQTEEEKIFVITEGTPYYSFFELVFALPDAIPSSLHLAEATRYN